jgi:hypothetical protein
MPSLILTEDYSVCQNSSVICIIKKFAIRNRFIVINEYKGILICMKELKEKYFEGIGKEKLLSR